jgi:LuxR family transcriptional regulator, maltose regulon positive regulatory protein
MVRFPQKLQIPKAARQLIERPILHERLSQAITAHRATIVMAAAGWGKTSALAQWARNAPLPIAWYALDKIDRDLRQFMAYLLAAVGPFVPAANEHAFHIDTARPDELPTLIRDTAAMIASATQPFALILDDLHLLTDSGEQGGAEHELLLELLVMLIDYAPACHLVLASRTLPRSIPDLARRLAQRQVALFDAVDLQWVAEDIQRLSAQQRATPFDDAAASALAERYNGWIMGITLALDYTHGHVAATRAVGGAHDGEDVYAFLAEQVIAPLPGDLQAFLEATSLLEDMSIERCNWLCEREDSAQLFDELMARGLFLARQGSWFSYHALFRDVLRARLARTPQRERRLLHRVGDLYAAEEDLEQAIACYSQIGAYEDAYTLLRTTVQRFRQRSRQTILLRCFDQLQAAIQPTGRFPSDLLLLQARVYGDLALWQRAYGTLDILETYGEQTMIWSAHILRAEALTIQGELIAARTSLNKIPPLDSLPLSLPLDAYFTAGRLEPV